MKTIQTFALLLAMAAATAAQAETIEMTVNGLVCGFCAQGIEKSLRKQEATADVVVSLEKRLVAVATKPGSDIPDEKLREVLKDAGYDLKEIVRTERSIAEIRAQLGLKP